MADDTTSQAHVRATHLDQDHGATTLVQVRDECAQLQQRDVVPVVVEMESSGVDVGSMNEVSGVCV